MPTDNFQRGDRALAAMRAYQDAGGTTAEEGLLGVEGFAQGYPMGDLVADLCHLMRRHDVAVDDMITQGVTHFAADVIEQAWHHDDDWNSCLQDPSNRDRAIAVMDAAGVPEYVYDDALRYVGLDES